MTVATGNFESARHVGLLPESHRCRGIHGHSFQASVFAVLREEWAPFPGGEVSELRQRMEQALEPLNYVDLNTVIQHPTDENIARWIRARLAVPGIDRIAVQSTKNQGVDLDRDGMAHVWRRHQGTCLATPSVSSSSSPSKRATRPQMRTHARTWI